MTDTLHLVTGTPLSHGSRTRDEQSILADSNREQLDQRRRKFADDMAHKAVHAEQTEFFDAFFPNPKNTSDTPSRPQLHENPFAALSDAEKLNEAVVRAAFTKAINDHDLVPGFKLRECGERPDPSTLDPERQKVDAAFFRNEHAPTDVRQSWADQILPVEFKRDDVSVDPFDDEKANISTETENRRKVRGQIISYAELVYTVQHRVALFMLVVVGVNVRFVRFDRSGAVVTRALNYVHNWEIFCDILWRIGQCTDTQLGLDPTATRLYLGERDFVRMSSYARSHDDDVDEKERDLKPGELPKKRVFKYVRAMFIDAVRSPWPRYRLEVPDGSSTRKFLVAKPTFRARGMAGRGTRGYVALDCATGEFVWLKDAWRAQYLLVEKEGDVLSMLNKANVKHVPTLICHGDIAGQETLTPKWWEDKHARAADLASSQSVGRDFSLSPSPSPSPSPSSGAMKRKHDDERSKDSVAPPKGADGGTGTGASSGSQD
ncbi:hypothetical protein DICSQDRAFT_172049 [Dichomitus squalens LYAD-421 SS1]|uniref:Fungal-type protein kinase domain-containing protein n=1 Tax=Dichomitus squalens (strain LYAD-421) TaxID=732165 RepID=R7SWT3_DICSQ|nr:uncharacterized protein DICSQDRAFT_172049 [Dichomitus squalens LYAD-421 SS1]EJF59452.1 hypothetical protein DICSQDRAFT_172049 [Dichomitus squalens LYAD-421 SS1]